MGEGRRSTEARKECGGGVGLRRRKGPILFALVVRQAPCVPGAPSDPARQAWVSVSRMRNCGVVGRAARPQSPGLHYLPAAHWAPWQEEKLLLTDTKEEQQVLSTCQAPSVSLQLSQGASGACCSTSPKPPWPRSFVKSPSSLLVGVGPGAQAQAQK